MRPAIHINGTRVVVTAGPDESTHQVASHEDAIELAARLEQEWEDDARKRAELLARYIDEGVDVVVPHPDDAAEWGLTVEPTPTSETVPAGSDSEPLEPPQEGPQESVSEPVGDDSTDPAPEPVVTATARWEPDTSRLVVTMLATEDVSMWRSMLGRNTSTFALVAGNEAVRAFKGEPGGVFELRIDGPDGELVLTETIPES